MPEGGPPTRARPTWRRRVQDRVTVPGLIAAGLMVVLIVVLIVIGRTAPSLGGSSSGSGASSSATPLFTPPGVSGVTTPGASGSAHPSAGSTSLSGTQGGVTFSPGPGQTARPTSSGSLPSTSTPTPTNCGLPVCP